MAEMFMFIFSHRRCLLKTSLNVGIKENDVLTCLTPEVNVQSEPIKARQFRGLMAHSRDLWLYAGTLQALTFPHGSPACPCKHKKF